MFHLIVENIIPTCNGSVHSVHGISVKRVNGSFFGEHEKLNGLVQSCKRTLCKFNNCFIDHHLRFIISFSTDSQFNLQYIPTWYNSVSRWSIFKSCILENYTFWNCIQRFNVRCCSLLFTQCNTNSSPSSNNN